MKKKQKDLEYRVWTVRLSEDNIEQLKEMVKDYKSWNQLFTNLLNKYEN